MRHAIVIGVGNEFAGDDGAGIEVARRLKAEAPPWVEIVEHDGEPARLMELWTGREVAWVVDAVRAGSAPGTVHRLEVGAEPVPDQPRRDSTHHLGLGEAIELSRAMGRLPESLFLIGIEGAHFEAGVGLSHDVRGTVAAVAMELARELAEITRDHAGDDR